MVWVKVPDEALDDPALDGVSDAAVIAYLRALCRSNRWALDGRVPVASVPSEIVAEWLAADLAEGDSTGNPQLVWLLKHQPTAEEITDRRRKDAERQERNRRHKQGDHTRCDPAACRVLVSRRDTTRDSGRDSRRDSAHPAPTRPDPEESRTERGTRADVPEASSRSREEQVADARRLVADPTTNPAARKVAKRALAKLGEEPGQDATTEQATGAHRTATGATESPGTAPEAQAEAEGGESAEETTDGGGPEGA
jgi:hypothetical protein